MILKAMSTNKVWEQKQFCRKHTHNYDINLKFCEKNVSGASALVVHLGAKKRQNLVSACYIRIIVSNFHRFMSIFLRWPLRPLVFCLLLEYWNPGNVLLLMGFYKPVFKLFYQRDCNLYLYNYTVTMQCWSL